MDIAQYIRPEFLALIPMLIVIGKLLKEASFFDDRLIPIALGACGVLIAVCYQVGDGADSLSAIVSAVIQGILCAGTAVYGNQIVKQLKKKDDTADDDLDFDL